MHHIAMQYFRM